MNLLLKSAYAIALLLATSMAFAAHTWSTPLPTHEDFAVDIADDTQPQVQHGSNLDVMAVWLRSSNPNSPQKDIVASYRVTPTANWSTPVTVNSDFATNGDIREVDLLYAGSGVWVCQWVDAEESTSASIVRVSRSTDFGQTWSAAATIFAYSPASSFYVHDLSSDTDGSGKIITTWILPADFREFVMVESTSGDYGQTWSTPFQWALRQYVNSLIGYGGNNVWTHATNLNSALIFSYSEIRFRLSTDNGVNWQENGSVVFEPIRENKMGDIAAAGNTVVMAIKFGRNTVRVYYSQNNGVTYAPNVDLPVGSDKGTISVAGDGLGHWLVTWDKRSDSGGLVVFESVDNCATWQEVDVPETTTEVSGRPTVEALGPGKFIMLYDQVNQKGQQNDSDIYYSVYAPRSPAAAQDWALFE